MSEFEFYFEKMMNFYNSATIKQLANAVNTLPSTVSNWHQRKSISAIKKKCRELGIYDEIFNSSNGAQYNIGNAGAISQSGNANFNTPVSSNTQYETKIDEMTKAIFETQYKNLKNEKDIESFRLYIMRYHNA